MDKELDQFLKQAAGLLAPYMLGQKHTTPTGTSSTPYLWGQGGLFNVMGQERQVISTRVVPSGLASQLPAFPSVSLNPLYPYLTGFTGTNSGTDPAGPCDDAKTAGTPKSCYQTAQFGRYSRMTRELDITRPAGQTPGEVRNLQFINDPLSSEIGKVLAPASTRNVQNWLGSEMLSRFVEVGVDLEMVLGRQFYTGNPANNNVGGGYEEFPGLDILISENKVDAKTGATCPSLYSLIRDFGHNRVDADNLNPDIVDTLTWMIRHLKHLGESTNFGAVDHAFTMRQSLFWELTAVWPCSYLTYRCKFRTTDGTVVQNVSANDQVAMRDAMRRGKYLLIDGEEVPVIIDSNIVENNRSHNAAIPIGGYASDIYIVPLRGRGMPLLYWEYYNYSQANTGAMAVAGQGRVGQYYWTDGGVFLWHAKPPKNFCIQHIVVTEPRIVLLTPHLAGRLQNVAYVPLIHERDAQPSDYYWVNGGQSTARPTDTFYSDWNLDGN